VVIVGIEQIVWVLSWLIAIHWSIVSFYVIFGSLGWILYRAPKSEKKAKNVEICIVSKACNNVKSALMQGIRHNATKFKEYRINVIVDEGSDLISELEKLTSIKMFKNVRLLVVPESFKCQAIAKGRAIEWFIQNHVEEDKWYAFIDDDNLILDDRFLYEIPHFEPNGHLAANAILFPRVGDSKTTFVADSLRYFDDLTIFRTCSGLLGRPYNGFHGELLLAKGKVLREVGFNRESITEDFAFARELLKRGYRTWQSATRVSILSPHSVKDLLKQRNRWYRGLIKDVWSGTLGVKLIAGIRILDWKVGIIGSWAFAPLWFFLPIPLEIKLFGLIGAVYYYIAYIYGAMRLKGFSRLKYIILLPIFSVIETIAPHLRVGNKKEFTVINK